MIEAIERKLEVDAPVEKIWRALTDPNEIIQWFGDKAELDARIGGSGWFGWKKYGQFAVRVEDVVPMKRFVWRWAKDADTKVDDGVSTVVEWTLTSREGGGTILTVRESGFKTKQHRDDNVEGWDFELAELLSHIEKA